MIMKHKFQRMLNDALNGEATVAPHVEVATINGKKPRLVSVHDNLVTISEHNPIDFLVKVMNGEPIPAISIDNEGNSSVEYDLPTLKVRIDIAKYLGNKLMPAMHVHKVIDDTIEPPKTGFEALVDRAIRRGGH